MRSRFEAYLLKLRETPVSDQTEHTGRAALEALLGHFASEATRGVHVQHEPKREKDKGAPDFKIERDGMILGYVEVKEIGTNLDKVLKSDQIRRYRELSDNILVTDYLQWIWIDRERVKGREVLAFATDLESRRIRVAPERAEAVGKLIAAFFSQAPLGIGRSQQLALALATRSTLLRDYLGEELVRQEREHKEGRLYGLFQVFRDQVFHELTLKEFADAFAQMLAYGLFLARLNSDSQTITLHNARQYVPGSFRLIRELVDFLTVLENDEYRDVRWVVEEVLSIVNGLDLVAIHEDLSFRQRKAINRKVRAADEEEHRLFERDPFIYFYEDYLKAYDAAMRKSRGVYYTPPPIVNFIVRAVDDILKESFGIGDGLADHERVTVLDFACGTGTFLLEAFERIFDNIGGPDTGLADRIVREHILKNLYGFEYLIAPYTIAHLKLSQYLRDRGHPLRDKERLQVFLTNTLEPIEPQPNFFVPAIAEEVKAAQGVKDKPILVILGNPPYSGHSKNKGAWISAAIGGYKFTVETDDEGKEFNKPLGERNPKWLNDDYVKFIRFAQLKMDAVEQGVVGIITNHSWLDNPTFRGMRQSLMRSFDRIYVLDLHGSTKPKERAPNGSKDENVFDVMKGVAISLFVKKRELERGVWRTDFWGRRLEKYEAAANATIETAAWQMLKPTRPSYLFIPQDGSLSTEYAQGRPVTEIFPIRSVGIVTARDNLCVQPDCRTMWRVVENFSRIPTERARENYGLGDDVEDWKVKWAQQDVRESGPDERNVVPILYRPFDLRETYYTGRSRGFMCRPREDVMQHMLRQNLALMTCRQVARGEWRHLGVTETIADDSLISNVTKERGYLFPLYTYQPQEGAGRIRADRSMLNDALEARRENVSPDFRDFLDKRYGYHYDAEKILGYVYAVLHAPTYRRRYAEFLRIDFPRIPFAKKRADFDALSALGSELVEAHLLRHFPRRKLAGYHGKGDHAVEAVRYASAEQAVWINKTQYFEPVPEDVWNFHIGGYQVIDKYLKSRKGRALSLDEIRHVSAVADSLAFTIEQMEKIDAAWGRAFPDRG